MNRTFAAAFAVLLGCSSSDATGPEAPEQGSAASTSTSATVEPDGDIARQAAQRDALEFGIQSSANSAGARPPTVRLGATSVTGKLSPELIQGAVRKENARLQVCYEEALGRNPQSAGELTVHYTIGKDGKVIDAKGEGSWSDETAKACVIKTFQGIMFPAPEAGVAKVSQPMTFAPGEAPPKP